MDQLEELYQNWKKKFQQLDKELDQFKGTKKQRHEIFGKRINELYQERLQHGFNVLQKYSSKEVVRDE